MQDQARVLVGVGRRPRLTQWELCAGWRARGACPQTTQLHAAVPGARFRRHVRVRAGGRSTDAQQRTATNGRAAVVGSVQLYACAPRTRARVVQRVYRCVCVGVLCVRMIYSRWADNICSLCGCVPCLQWS